MKNLLDRSDRATGENTPACWLGEVSRRSSSISLKSIKLVNHSDNPNRTEIGQRQGGVVRYLSVTRKRTPIFKS